MLPRPTLQRTLKYLGVVPRANSKLQREARRGSHDLRRLVGHANLLDTLMDNLDVEAAEREADIEARLSEANANSPAEEVSRHTSWSEIDFGGGEEWETDNGSLSSESGSEDDEIVTPTDDEDGDDLGLTRTRSHLATDSAVKVVPVVAGLPSTAALSVRELLEDTIHTDVPDFVAKINDVVTDELNEAAEDYFQNKSIVQERAQVAASLASFDVGTAVCAAVGEV